MIHGFITIAWCVLCAVLKLPWPFYFWPVAFYLGREHAQAEERYMRARNLNRAKAPWWMGFSPSVWNAKSLLDWLLPLGMATATWLVAAVYL